MAITTGFHHHPPLPLSRTPRRTTLFLLSPAFAAAAAVARRACAIATPPRAARDRDGDDATIADGPEPRRKSPLDLAPLLALAAGASGGPRAALAASGGSMGGSSDDSSDSFSSCCDDSSSGDSWWSSSPSVEEGKEAVTHESVGTAPVELSPATKRSQDMLFWGTIALASAALVMAVLSHAPPRTTVVKLQVALRGVAAAKSFQKDLNEIAEKVQDSNQRWYKFILTETIRSLRCYKDSCISSSLSVDVKDSWNWKEPFNKISIEERSKFDEETFSNLDGIKRKRSYSKKTDGSKNEYIVVTILIAAEGALEFLPLVRNSADLEAVVGKLNSIPAGEIRGIHVLWTPQQEDDVLSQEELKENYPYLKPFAVMGRTPFSSRL